MKRITQFAIFLSVFSSIYFLLNWFVFSQIAVYLGIEKNTLYWALLLFATFSFLIATLIENSMSNLLSKSIYFLASVWMGFLFIQSTIFLIAFIAHFINRHHLFLSNPLGAFVGYVLLGLGISISLYALFNACRIKIKKITIQNKKIKHPLHIAHLSDLHLGPIHKYAYLERIVKKVNELKADHVMITGDLIDGPGKLPDDLLEDLNKIKVPIYYSVGNHELYIGIDHARRLIKNTKAHFLDNEMMHTKDMTVLGIEHSEDNGILAKKLPAFSIDKNKFNVLLYHAPENLEDACKAGIDLMLSGHTHAGQIFPFNFLVKLRFRRIYGLFEHNGTFLHITSGSGTWGPPMRLGSDCEITHIEIVPSEK